MDMHKIVKKMSRKSSKAFDLSDIAEYVDPEFSKGEAGKSATYKLAYRLKSAGVLVSIKNGLYLLVDESERDGGFNEIRAVESSYWKIVKKLITKNCGSDYVLAGPKSLEIRMRDLSIPDTLIVYTKDYSGILTVSDRHKVVFKTAKTGAKTGRTNAFPYFSRLAETVDIEGTKFKTAGIEHAILDTLTVHKGISTTDEYVVSKFLSKYPKTLDRDVLGKLVSCKYLTAVNRLREIARDKRYADAYEKALDVVKREGGNCFVTGA